MTVVWSFVLYICCIVENPLFHEYSMDVFAPHPGELVSDRQKVITSYHTSVRQFQILEYDYTLQSGTYRNKYSTQTQI